MGIEYFIGHYGELMCAAASQVRLSSTRRIPIEVYALKASISLHTMIGKRWAYTMWYEDRQVMIRFENYRNHNFFCATCHNMCQPMYRSEELAQHFLYWNMQAHHCDDAALSGSVEQLPELQAFHTSNSSQHQHLKPISVVQSIQKQDERHN